ncbi:MAG: hypothetical protein ACE5JO_10570, partial [Candidatus Binatia bacterium]
MMVGFKQAGVTVAALTIVWLGFCLSPSQSSAGRENRRPSLAESALSSSPGEIEIGVGYLFGHDTRPVDVSLLPPAQGRSRDGNLTLAPTIDLALGITDRIEFQLSYDIRFFDPEDGDSEWGTGDVRLFGKFHLLKSRGYFPHVGVRLGVKLPIAQKE